MAEKNCSSRCSGRSEDVGWCENRVLKQLRGDKKKKKKGRQKGLFGSLRGKCGKIYSELEFLGRKKNDKKPKEVLVSPPPPRL